MNWFVVEILGLLRFASLRYTRNDGLIFVVLGNGVRSLVAHNDSFGVLGWSAMIKDHSYGVSYELVCGWSAIACADFEVRIMVV
jgi:hypothetical protein